MKCPYLIRTEARVPFAAGAVKSFTTSFFADCIKGECAAYRTRQSHSNHKVSTIEKCMRCSDD